MRNAKTAKPKKKKQKMRGKLCNFKIIGNDKNELLLMECKQQQYHQKTHAQTVVLPYFLSFFLHNVRLKCTNLPISLLPKTLYSTTINKRIKTLITLNHNFHF